MEGSQGWGKPLVVARQAVAFQDAINSRLRDREADVIADVERQLARLRASSTRTWGT
jgi:hypothetical protein